MQKKSVPKLLMMSFIIILSLVATGCQAKNEQKTATEAKKATITIQDSTGKEFSLPRGINRIVLLNSDAAEALIILGVPREIIIGVSDSVKENPYLGLENKPSVGGAFTPSIEKLVQLKPQVVIAYSQWPDKKLEEKLEPVGIRVIRLDFYKPETYDRDLAAAAKIFEKEKKAEAFLKWKSEKTALLTERVKKLNQGEKLRVFGTWYSSFEKGEWKPYGKGTALHQGIELAGGLNIAGELEGYPAVSAEWVLQKNPQAAVFGVLEGKGLGYTATDTAAVTDMRNQVSKNSVLSKTEAGQKNRIYFLNTQLLGGSKTYLGALYLARWLYPELFKEIEPDQVLQEYFEKWLGVPFKGIWAYP